jgi:excisionase family DNA binding protein
MNPEYITTTEAARVCGVTPQTIRNWIRSGKITTEPTLGGHNRIPRDQAGLLLLVAATITEEVPSMVATDEL